MAKVRCVPGAADPKDREGLQEIFLGRRRVTWRRVSQEQVWGPYVTKWGTERQLR